MQTDARQLSFLDPSTAPRPAGAAGGLAVSGGLLYHLGVLRDNGHATMHLLQVPSREGDAVEAYHSARGVVKAQHEVHKCALSAAAPPHEGTCASGGDVEIDPLDDLFVWPHLVREANVLEGYGSLEAVAWHISPRVGVDVGKRVHERKHALPMFGLKRSEEKHAAAESSASAHGQMQDMLQW